MNDAPKAGWSAVIVKGSEIPSSRDFESIVQLRFAVLRAPLGLSLDSARFPGDNSPSSLHFLGFLENEPIACVTLVQGRPESAKVVPKSLHTPRDLAIQLRGMAVADGYRGQNLGRRILDLVHEWATQNNQSLWCHARSSAAGFYRRQNWKDCSDPFDIPPIGEHIVMYWTPRTV